MQRSLPSTQVVVTWSSAVARMTSPPRIRAPASRGRERDRRLVAGVLGDRHPPAPLRTIPQSAARDRSRLLAREAGRVSVAAPPAQSAAASPVLTFRGQARMPSQSLTERRDRRMDEILASA